MLMPHSDGMSLHAMSPSALSHHQVQVEMVLGSEGNSGLVSLVKDRGRASTLYTARDRARKPASRDEDRFILRERGREEKLSKYGGTMATRRDPEQYGRRTAVIRGFIPWISTV